MKGLSIHPLGMLLPVAYLAFSPRVNKPLYRKLLFRPTEFPRDCKELPVVSGVRARECFFKSEGRGVRSEELHGWFFAHPQSDSQSHSKEPGRAALISHGNAGNMSTRLGLVELLLACGSSVFLYDYRGYGKSTGKPCVQGVCADGISALDYLRALLPGETPVVLYGESLGAAVSTAIARKRSVDGLILQSGFSSLGRIARENYAALSLYPDFLFPNPYMNSRQFLSDEHPPVVIIHGTDDPVVPVSHAQELYLTARGDKQLILIEDAHHSDLLALGASQMRQSIEHLLKSIG